MLDIRRVLASAPKKHTEETLNSLSTVWGEALDPSNVLPEYPRPRMQRDNYVMLNGVWDYAIVSVDGGIGVETLARQAIPSRWDGQIVVPFSPEAPLSGVGRTVQPSELLWNKRKIELPKLADDQRLILHFEAVDWMCACFVNGKLAGTHVGGYLPFSFDVTDLLGSPETGESAGADLVTAAGVAESASTAESTATAELVLCVWDPSDTGSQLRGKQRLLRGDIWYTAQSGIWQSVWYEIVSAVHLESLTLKGDMFGALEVRANVQASGLAGVQTGAFKLELTLKDELGQGVLLATLPVNEAGEISAELHVDDPLLWSPESPHLYSVEATLQRDGVVVDAAHSYCAFRTVEVKKDVAGVPRVHLNGAPYFVRGVLDQGYWPDGLLTAPSDDALVYDVEAMKSAGFNTLRKHIKIESERWYYHCDREGMLVWQDMPSGDMDNVWEPRQYGGGTDRQRSEESVSNYYHEWGEIMDLCISHPSVIIWVPFNEAWGQFDTEKVTAWTEHRDPSRLVNPASGGNHRRCGSILDLHNYPGPEMYLFDPERVTVLGEYGGIGLALEGHLWWDKRNWGYVQFKNKEEVTAEYVQFAKTLQSFVRQGFSAAVYTQTTDVEGEVNGLMTYDRKEIKINEAEVRAANQEVIRILSE